MSGSAVSLIRPAPAPVTLTTLDEEEVDLVIDNPATRVTWLVDLTAAVTVNLPPCDAADVGTEYAFFISVNTSNFTLNCDTGDVFIGNVLADTGVGVANVIVSDGTKAQLVLTTPGVGSYVLVVMVSSTQWAIEGTTLGAASFP